MKGIIFSVKRYSVHDGPGIRTTFFLKGCPMNCRWCHNPEGISPEPEFVKKCIRIGDKDFFKDEKAGEQYDVKSVIDILEKEKVFFNHSNGGVTFSGGEPMMQFEFLREALKECKSHGYHTAIDTSGYAPAEKFNSIMEFTDLFLFDIKHLDDLKHLSGTGVSNATIVENFKFLLQNGKELILRIPVIPGFNDDKVYIEKLRNFILDNMTFSLRKICLLPFHKIGASKYKRFNIENRMEGIEPPNNEEILKLKEYFLQTGVPVKIGG